MKRFASANTMSSDACAPFSFAAKMFVILSAMVAAIAFLFVVGVVLNVVVISIIALVLISVLPLLIVIRGRYKSQTSI